MTKKEVRKQIDSKFGTLSRFARLSGLDRYELQKIFARKAPDEEMVKAILKKISSTRDKPEPKDLTSQQINGLKRAIKKAGGVYKFAREHPEFSEKSLYQIIGGMRTRITPKIRELFDYFEL